MRRVLGDRVEPALIDTACSSSLYAIHAGIEALKRDHADMVIAGGVCSPGPANTALFAQFRGLSTRHSRPLDADADGVVFGDGGAVVALKRLPDALAAGDRILGVIRGIGLSSDGKSAAINVPKKNGQLFALERAYRRSDIDRQSIEYLEAHATATTVGDAVEFSAISEFFGDRPPEADRIPIESVKSLIGHTAWLSGVASLIKVCLCFEHDLIPPQANFETPSPEFDLEGSPFQIPLESLPFPAHPDGSPRRAAVSGFGFGGTNAHLIVESFECGYHGRLAERERRKAAPEPLAVVGVAGLFPASGELSHPRVEPAGPSGFDRSRMRLPKGKLLLPDVTDHMDASQYLAVHLADQLLTPLAGKWEEFRDDIAVVLGMTAKTERGVMSVGRLYLDRLLRRVSEIGSRQGIAAPESLRVARAIADRIRSEVPVSGPYSLSGLMPNVTASRASFVYDLHGPNLVVDAGDNSLLKAVALAADLVDSGHCEMAIAGGIHASADSDGEAHESAVAFGLARLESARLRGLEVLAVIEVDETGSRQGETEITERVVQEATSRRGATGGVELLAACDELRAGGSDAIRLISASPASSRSPSVLLRPAPRLATVAESEPSHGYDYVRGTPLSRYGVEMVPTPRVVSPLNLQGKRLVVLVDRPATAIALADSPILAGASCHFACAGEGGERVVPIDLNGCEGSGGGLAQLCDPPPDGLIAVADLTDRPATPEGVANGQQHFELIALSLRQLYSEVARGKTFVGCASAGGIVDDQLHPASGLVSGFLRSVSRELPGARISMVSSDAGEPGEAIAQLVSELDSGILEGEVCYRGEQRSVLSMSELDCFNRGDGPRIDSDWVVVATGGARGITAALMEELLETYGCTVVALGRSDASEVPQSLLAMSEQELKDHEAAFYRQGLSDKPAGGILELKRRFRRFLAGHEIVANGERAKLLGGQWRYLACDLRDAEEVDRTVERIYSDHGRIDMVIHGAGIQASKALSKKSLDEIRGIVATKVEGLANLHRAISRDASRRPVKHWHVLTSVFSFLGNDGQPDYGGANEALTRLAACMDSAQTRWTSMGWMGWGEVGMASGSEMRVIAGTRGLRGLSSREGRQMFGELVSGSPSAPVNYLLAQGEIDYYNPPIAARGKGAKPPPKKHESRVQHQPITLQEAPFLADHLFRGTPTIPGAMIAAITGWHASQLFPELRVVGFEDVRFHRFLKVHGGRQLDLRVQLEPVLGDGHCSVNTKLFGDFVHHSGTVLQRDILFYEGRVLLAATFPEPERVPERSGARSGTPLDDPYFAEGTDLRLKGRFRPVVDLEVGVDWRSARYLPHGRGGTPTGGLEHLWPCISLVDTLFRFSAVHLQDDDSLPIYVPIGNSRVRLYFDILDPAAAEFKQEILFAGGGPQAQGELVTLAPTVAFTAEDRALLVVEGLQGRLIGRVNPPSSFSPRAVPGTGGARRLSSLEPTR